MWWLKKSVFSRRKRRVCENCHRWKDTLETGRLNVKKNNIKAIWDNWGDLNTDWV